MTRDGLIQTFAEAIAHYEGFYPTEWLLEQPGRWPSRAKRNNNPGNFRAWARDSFIEGGYVKFPTVGEGYSALRRQIEKNVFVRGLNLIEFFGGQRLNNGTLVKGGYSGYAPAADMNHPSKYASYVLQFLRDRGVPIESINQKIADVVDQPVN